MCKNCFRHNPKKKDDEDVKIDLHIKTTKHGRGKVCSFCGARKPTKKIGSKYACVNCRAGRNG